MIIQPNWTITDQGPWQLIYSDTRIISLAESIGITSTEAKVFVGTEAECEAERVRLGLPWAAEVVIDPDYQLIHDSQNIEAKVFASDVVLDPDYQLIHDSQNILYLSIAGSSVDIAGTSFVGKLQECEAEIAQLGLKHPHEIEESEEP